MRRRMLLGVLTTLLLGAACAKQKPVEVSGPPIPPPPAPRETAR